MEIKVKLFGMLADELQRQEMTLNGVSDLRSLEHELSALHPVFHRKLVNDNVVLHTGDEVAVMPPFSGG